MTSPLKPNMLSHVVRCCVDNRDFILNLRVMVYQNYRIFFLFRFFFSLKKKVLMLNSNTKAAQQTEGQREKGVDMKQTTQMGNQTLDSCIMDHRFQTWHTHSDTKVRFKHKNILDKKAVHWGEGGLVNYFVKKNNFVDHD